MFCRLHPPKQGTADYLYIIMELIVKGPAPTYVLRGNAGMLGFFSPCAIVAVQNYWLDCQLEMFNSAKRIKILYTVQWLSRRLDYLHLRLTVRSWKINLGKDPGAKQSKLITCNAEIMKFLLLLQPLIMPRNLRCRQVFFVLTKT